MDTTPAARYTSPNFTSPPPSPLSLSRFETQNETQNETQFIPRSDDDETLWNVECILRERRGEYLVKWEGRDPATGEPWPHSWVAKHDCTDDLIAEWKGKKRKSKVKDKEARGRGRPRKKPAKELPLSEYSDKETAREESTVSAPSPQSTKKSTKKPHRKTFEIIIETPQKRISKQGAVKEAPRPVTKRKWSPAEGEAENASVASDRDGRSAEESEDEPEPKKKRIKRWLEGEALQSSSAAQDLPLVAKKTEEKKSVSDVESEVQDDRGSVREKSERASTTSEEESVRSPTPTPQAKKRKGDFSEEVLPPPPNPPPAKKRLRSPPREASISENGESEGEKSPISLSQSGEMNESQTLSPLGPFQTQEREYVEEHYKKDSEDGKKRTREAGGPKGEIEKIKKVSRGLTDNEKGADKGVNGVVDVKKAKKREQQRYAVQYEDDDTPTPTSQKEARVGEAEGADQARNTSNSTVRALSRVPDLSPSQFDPYLPLPAREHSPLEEFTPPPPPNPVTQSTIDEFSRIHSTLEQMEEYVDYAGGADGRMPNNADSVEAQVVSGTTSASSHDVPRPPPLTAHPTPRTLRRTQILSTHTDDVPSNAFDQLDKALKLLNEKSEEVYLLRNRLLDQDKAATHRELKFQKELDEIVDQNRTDYNLLQESETFFKNLYMQVSEKHKETELLLEAALSQKEVLQQQLNVGIPQVHEHYRVHLEQLKFDLRMANSRADLFMEQASRTEQINIRTAAAEAPILREKNARLRTQLAEAEEREQALTIKLRSSEDSAIVANMRQELARLMAVESTLRADRRALQKGVKHLQEEIEKNLNRSRSAYMSTTQESGMENGEDNVLPCEWRLEDDQFCYAALDNREHFTQHLKWHMGVE